MNPDSRVVEFDPHVTIALILLLVSVTILLLLIAFLMGEKDTSNRRR